MRTAPNVCLVTSSQLYSIQRDCSHYPYKVVTCSHMRTCRECCFSMLGVVLIGVETQLGVSTSQNSG